MKDILSGSKFIHHFPCRAATGTPTTFTGSVSVLQGTAATGGITWGASLATTDKVGIYQVVVDTASVCYPTGYDYTVIAYGTTSGVYVTEPVAEFSIENGNNKADIIWVSGDNVAADNLEAMFDGTGYAGGTTKLNTEVVTKTGFALTSDYDPAKTAATQISVNNAYSSIYSDILTLRAQVASATNLAALQASVNAIPTVVPPTVAEMNARTMPTVLYATHSDTNDIDSAIAALPTITYTQLTDRTLPTAQYATHSDIVGISLSLSTSDVADISNAVVAALGTPASQDSLDTVSQVINSCLVDILLVQDQTDQLVFVNGKVDANAEATLPPESITQIIDGVVAGVGGGGTIAYSDTVEYPAGTPLPGVEVLCCSDSLGQDIIAPTFTNDLGRFTFYLSPVNNDLPEPNTSGHYWIAVQHPQYQGVLTPIVVTA